MEDNILQKESLRINFLGGTKIKMEKSMCPQCAVELSIVPSTSSNLVLHCPMCGGQYSCEIYSDLTIQNSSSTTVDKLLRCTVCSREFTQASGLKRHFAVHTGERPFPCITCGKSFKTKAALKRHHIIHTGECPFECTTCKRRFNQISNLRKHLLIHNNKCPFYCSTCGKGFNQLSNLKKHMRVHERRPDVMTKRSKKTERDTRESFLKDRRPVLTFVKPAEGNV